MSTNPGDELTLMEMTRRFPDDDSARRYFEAIRWPIGPVCPHCGNIDSARIYKVTPNLEKKIRAGLYKCAECQEGFTVTINTVMEDSHLPLNKWLLAFYMMCASKTQVSALQLQRQLEIGSYRSAWFLCHRIRFALKSTIPSDEDKLSGIVEADETYIGGKRRGRGRGYVGNKTAVVSLVERSGRVRSTVVEKVIGPALDCLLKAHIHPHLNTDESPAYTKTGEAFASHDTVNHSVEEYSRHDEDTGRHATTNTAEGFFGNSMRSLDGIHHHVSGKHLPLYLAELDYKYNTRKVTDGARTASGIRLMEGKRLTYRWPST
jgi:transposase-like protein